MSEEIVYLTPSMARNLREVVATLKAHGLFDEAVAVQGALNGLRVAQLHQDRQATLIKYSPYDNEEEFRL